MRSIQHYYCQKCLAANPLGQELCVRCGTRLMLVVEPPAARFEDGATIASHEEHLLERISTLENRLLRMSDRLGQTLDIMLRQARTAYTDHVLIESLIAVLHETGAVQSDLVINLWRERCQHEVEEKEKTARLDHLRRQIINAYKGGSPLAFEQLVNDGIDLIDKGEGELGIRILERAAAHDPVNAPLHALVGEHYFKAEQSATALSYLERAQAADPKNQRVALLLGLSCCDVGELQRGRVLLGEYIKEGGESFAAHYALGMLFVAEKKWGPALREFKRALAARTSPEAHYITGCAYFHLDRYHMAARHLQQAVELDGGFAAAFYALGFALLRSGKEERAREAFRLACENAEDETRYKASVKRLLRTQGQNVNPKFFGIEIGARKGFITGVDGRLARFVLLDAVAIDILDELEIKSPAC